MCQVNTPKTVPFGTSSLDNDTLKIPEAEYRSQMDELVFDTTNLVFDIETEINSTSSDKEVISMVGFMEEDRMCLVRFLPGS